MKPILENLAMLAILWSPWVIVALWLWRWQEEPFLAAMLAGGSLTGLVFVMSMSSAAKGN